ncbi:hypothetical protein DFH07DRAFT_985370 [Mycena maculata]|uniref:Uncharacterized protein n=1 Tax=Mycena maculata TaxID=230809 RepID=A0AAD7MXW0_9AGAR|nr:hypothetical protein DFH07DRAFT_985370 [Mycena maculata]
MDLTPSYNPMLHFHDCMESLSTPENIMLLNDPNQETGLIASMELNHYHAICYMYLRLAHSQRISAGAELHLGAVIYCPWDSLLEGSVEIASLADCIAVVSGRCIDNPCFQEIMEDGWTSCIDKTQFRGQGLLALSRLEITSDYEDYALLEKIYFRLQISRPTQESPRGYLFVCPKQYFRTGPTSFAWPDHPAYWALDPSGAGGLSEAEATRLEFPAIQLSTECEFECWDASVRVYAGIREFHEGRGFDPGSQAVAQHLGDRLFKLSSEAEPSFAHGEANRCAMSFDWTNTKLKKVDDAGAEDAEGDYSVDSHSEEYDSIKNFQELLFSEAKECPVMDPESIPGLSRT